jgi:predicted transglutaminase-like cysteine proteinase
VKLGVSRRCWPEIAAKPQPKTGIGPKTRGGLGVETNRFLNDWRYKPDDQNYGQRDYWATPLEFLRRSGDCEDYAIAKYVTLRELGFAP